MRFSWCVVPVAAFVLTGCGTTVPVAGTPAGGSAPGNGLTAPLPDSPAPTAPSLGPGPAAPPGSVGAAPPSTAGPQERPGAAAPGVTADRSPIKVGVLGTNNDAAASAGVDNGNSFTPRRAFAALVKAWNARGGVAGRRVVPVYREIASSSSSYSSELEAVCTAFTQDQRVEVVVSATGLYDESFGSCFGKAGIPWLPGDYALGDEQALRSSSTLLTTTTVTTDVRMTALLRRLVATGELGRASRLGVVVEGCPYNQRTYERTVAPLARQLGLTIAESVESRCFLGIGDLSGVAAEMQGAVLRFQSSRVDRVLFVSGSVEANLVLFFMTAAEGQQYRPRYGLTSAGAPVLQKQNNTPSAQLRNVVGVGWLPDLDVDRPAATATTRRCLADLRRGGLTPAGALDRFTAYGACDTLGVLDALLRRTAGRAPLLPTAAPGLGRSFVTAATYGGSSDLSGRRAAAGAGRVFAWSAACSCFAYSGRPFALAG